MLSAQQRGIQVPQQLAVVGYNALDIGQTISPKLTSVDTPRFQIGVKSAELLIARLKGEAQEEKCLIWVIRSLQERVFNSQLTALRIRSSMVLAG